MNQPEKKILRLGTRQSLLAMAQSREVARLIECANPDIDVRLTGIETRGDRELDVPLSAIEGKEFFVAELDKALLNGDVDLTVHSMKDLSLTRPRELTLAAIPRRENPRDVVLFSPDIIDRLAAGAPIRIGTSSPRRVENLAPFLTRALPDLGKSPRIVTNAIRGNVDTRIGYLSLADDDEKKIDGVVLALAGLIRLWADTDGRAALSRLLSGLRWMVLPLEEFPTAPAQGALAIECRANDSKTLDLLAGLHCSLTAGQVEAERRVLEEQGGGCHQRFGATSVTVDELGSMLFIRGKMTDDRFVGECRWSGSGQEVPAPLWDGTRWRGDAFMSRQATDIAVPDWLGRPGAMFIAHSRALPESWLPTLCGDTAQRIWTSGTKSWFRLASRGVWVEGCAEQFGFAVLQPTLEQGVLGLPALGNWQILSHGDAVHVWPEHEVTVTYEVSPAEPLHSGHAAVMALREARSAFWTSGSQFDAFREWIPDGCRHACRYGRTFFYLRQQGLADVTAWPSISEWHKQGER
jgi:hydroxymethylbilane synthase